MCGRAGRNWAVRVFFFFSDEGWEPPHVHVERGGGVVKYWLKPVAMAYFGCDYFGT